MLEPCEDCHFKDSVRTFGEEYAAIAERSCRIEARAFDAAYWMITLQQAAIDAQP